MADAPKAPIEVEIRINGDDWSYIQRRLCDLAQEAEMRTPETFRMYGGGAGGAYSVNVAQRDVSIEQYHAELEAWRVALKPLPPPEAPGNEG